MTKSIFESNSYIILHPKQYPSLSILNYLSNNLNMQFIRTINASGGLWIKE